MFRFKIIIKNLNKLIFRHKKYIFNYCFRTQKSIKIAISLTCFLFFIIPAIAFAQINIAKEHYEKGEIELHIGDFNAATKYYTKAIEKFKNYHEAYYGRGKSYLYLKKNEKALEDFKKASEIKPKANYFFYTGLIHYQTKKFEDALPAFDQALFADSTYSLAYNYRAEAYRELGLNTQAISDYSKAIQYVSKEATLYCGRGRAYLQAEKYAAAVLDFTQAIRLEPRKETYLHYRIEANFALQNYFAVVEDIEQMIEIRKDSTETHYFSLLAFCESHYQNYKKATEAISKVIQREPQNTNHLLERATYFIALQDYPNAIKDYTSVLELDASNVNHYLECAKLYRQIGNFDASIIYLDSAILTDSTNAESWYWLGMSYLELNQKKEAKLYLNKAIDLGFPTDKIDKKAVKYIRKRKS